MVCNRNAIDNCLLIRNLLLLQLHLKYAIQSTCITITVTIMQIGEFYITIIYITPCLPATSAWFQIFQVSHRSHSPRNLFCEGSGGGMPKKS